MVTLALMTSKQHFFTTLFMQEAINEALKAFEENEVPVGAVIVNNSTNEIVARAYNLIEQKNNPVMHAEIIAINQACMTLGTKKLSHCDIYVSLEPCTMCASAISFAKIGRLFYAASDPKQGAVEHGVRFFTSNTCLYRPEIYQGHMAEFSKKLMKSFFSKIRKDSL